MRHFGIDQEAQVWVAESPDILGLVTEADNLDRLTNKLKQMIPELLAANHQMAIENNKSDHKINNSLTSVNSKGISDLETIGELDGIFIHINAMLTIKKSSSFSI